MAKASSGKTSSGGGSTKRTTAADKQKGEAHKGAIREEFLRKKDELLKIKSLDTFLIKDAMGINPKKSDMKPELKGIVERLKLKKSKGI